MIIKTFIIFTDCGIEIEQMSIPVRDVAEIIPSKPPWYELYIVECLLPYRGSLIDAFGK